ncbi:MAG: FmdB family transcriptional regulator [Mycobacterium sp.]|nr:FmdB family transcriptional regulator [Mycobacterium sp.]
MPTYSYACTECDNKFDAVQAFTDDALTTCPACQGRLRKLFNSVGVVFKGSGFYRNDSRESGKSNGSSEKSSEKAPDSAKPSEKPPGKSSEKAAGSGGSGSSSASSSSTPAPASASS